MIAPDCGLLIGAGIDLDCISLVATGLDGHPRASLLLPGTTDAERAIATLQRGVAELRADYGGQQGRVLGIGIGVPGLMDAAGRLVLAPHLGWRDLPIVTRLRAAFQVPVYVDNDNKAAVLAEHIFGVARGIADFVFMYGHTGIGGGLYLGGRLYRGCNGMAGELGHMKIVPGGRGCVCGGRGCVEAYVSARAIGERLRETGRDLTEKALTEAAAAGDPVVRTVLDEAGSYLGLTIANLVNIMNPRAVVVGGNLAALAAFMLPAARAVLVANSIDKMLDETQILTSTLGAESIAMGGVALALEGFLPLPQGLRGIAAS
jgi:predicted NBD/HSP70 family sugar kinase